MLFLVAKNANFDEFFLEKTTLNLFVAWCKKTLILMIIRTCNFLFISGLAFLILLIDIDNDIDHQATSTITQIQLKTNDMLITTSITKLPLLSRKSIENEIESHETRVF